MTPIMTLLTFLLGSWTIMFDEATSQATFTNADRQIVVTGKFSFVSDGKEWKIAPARDAVGNRLALIDPRNNVQGYITFQHNGERLSFLVEHRTRQHYEGTFAFDGTIEFRPDSFACRTVPLSDAKVLPLAAGPADSLVNDSLFSREEDLAFQAIGSHVSITTLGDGRFGLTITGEIQKPNEATVAFNVEENYFRSRYVPYYSPINRTRCPSPPTGWMSWNTYFDQAGVEENLAEARLGQKYLQPFGMEFWSIESWQGNSDHLPVGDFYNMNLEVNERQFPEGMKRLADDIRALGFRPGIWMAPYGTGNEEFYRDHPDWFLHDADGKPISSWNGRFTMDPTVPEAIDHLRRIHEVAAHQWGYEFFKVDGMSGEGPHYMAHCYERPEVRARFRDPYCPNPFEKTVAAIREGIGPDRVLLACQGHFTGPEAEVADAARIGSDIVHANQPVKWENVLNQAGRTINQIFVNNIVFFTDPDTLLVGDLETEQARVSAVVVSLPGQMMFAGDKLATLTPEKIEILQKTLPVADIRPMNLYPCFELLPVWDLRIARPFGTWDVVALFNWDDAPKRVGFRLDELGVTPEIDYLAYEFWTEQFLGTISEEFSMEIPPRAVRLLALHPKKGTPQFLSSDRHLTQGGVDLTALDWDEKAKRLSGKVRLVANHPTTLRFAVPDGFTWSKTETVGNVKEKTASESEGGVLALTLTADESGEAGFALDFQTVLR